MSTVYAVDESRWAKLDIFNQMGNIYSEVGRSFSARRKNNLEDSQAAMYRSIDLFDATINALAKQKSPRLKEVLRAKDQYLTIFNDSQATDDAIVALDNYFLQFATAARLHR